ncbi:MAG: hypothetical protein IT454_12080 [Planctomycetes bacterium]|nr:hypothetical protein [Planctomycetota bacterium]
MAPGSKHVYVDANVFVEYFEAASPELKHLELLQALVERDFKLWLPTQTWSEFAKNRGAKLEAALVQLENQAKSPAIPVLVREFGASGSCVGS